MLITFPVTGNREFGYLSIYASCHRRAVPCEMPYLRAGVMLWLQEWCSGCRSAAQPCLTLWAAAQLLRDTQWGLGEMPMQTADKAADLHWLGCWRAQHHSSGHLTAPRGLLPSRTAHFSQPTADPHRSHRERRRFQQQSMCKPGITSPNLAEGCPEEKTLITHCLKQWPGAAVKMPKAFLALSTGSFPPVPDTEGGIFSLSFKS